MFKVTIDDSQVQLLVRDLGEKSEETIAVRAINVAAKKTADMARASAVASGLGATGRASNGGWSWTRLGRIPRSIVVSRKWKKSGKVGKKVFASSSKKRLYSARAPHANLSIVGYNQWIPTGVPGKGNVRRSKLNPVKPPRPVFSAAMATAQASFNQAAIDALRRALRNASKRKGAPPRMGGRVSRG